MSSNGKEYRNFILISQVSISILVPTFGCLALGVWLDDRFGTWFTLPLLILGMAAGARNAYALVMGIVRKEERLEREKQEKEIKRKVEESNDRKAKGIK